MKAVGDYTSAMRDLAPGDGARIEGPYGAFSYRKIANRSQVWISGGIGVTPFLSMARDLDDAPEFDIDLYYCTKSLEAARSWTSSRRSTSTHPTFRVIPFPEDVRGFITAGEVQQQSARMNEADILICGPRQMIDSLTAQFTALGVPRRGYPLREVQLHPARQMISVRRAFRCVPLECRPVRGPQAIWPTLPPVEGGR